MILTPILCFQLHISRRDLMLASFELSQRICGFEGVASPCCRRFVLLPALRAAGAGAQQPPTTAADACPPPYRRHARLRITAPVRRKRTLPGRQSFGTPAARTIHAVAYFAHRAWLPSNGEKAAHGQYGEHCSPQARTPPWQQAGQRHAAALLFFWT
ncbi:hypothetical protein NPIL_523161 [Nephila pilipes]|uniref:Uncharacterized protein n=1 Tax=Nephila pilipes TaxID=299642 RepID=A0A8X6R420_NEPPI|nr:hypothetical protein NPIL_523161 [Nephila pilipes]